MIDVVFSFIPCGFEIRSRMGYMRYYGYTKAEAIRKYRDRFGLRYKKLNIMVQR